MPKFLLEEYTIFAIFSNEFSLAIVAYCRVLLGTKKPTIDFIRHNLATTHPRFGYVRRELHRGPTPKLYSKCIAIASKMATLT